jgi:hypothetical protein
VEQSGVKRKLAAILSADVAGYSRLMGAEEEATLKTLTTYREAMGAFIARHDGRIFGTAGDSVVAEFASAIEAVRCAIEIQQELKDRNAALAEERRMEFRIGINLGDVMIEGDDLYGDGVRGFGRTFRQEHHPARQGLPGSAGARRDGPDQRAESKGEATIEAAAVADTGGGRGGRRWCRGRRAALA